jgi:prepilin-type N-terminal cleavage/methylation domain-containing protein
MSNAVQRIKRERSKGLSLVELMIAITISSAVIAGAYNLFIVERRSYSLQDDLAQMYQTMRSSEQTMVREIRMAGYKLKDITIWSDVPGTGFTDGEKEDIEEATSGAFTFTADVDGDGVVETVRYALRNNELVRQLWRWDTTNNSWRSGGGARSMADNMEELDMSYLILADNDGIDNDLDDDGDSIADELGEMLLSDQPGKTERHHLRAVRLTMTAKAPRPDKLYTHPIHGDHYRRMTLSTTITPRNMGL